MRDAHTVPPVFVVAPGGLGERGGIGRLVGATVRHWRAVGLRPALRVVDPYGLTLSPMTLLYFLRAVGQIGSCARRGRIALLHVHMAARGSAVRKGIITHVAARSGIPVLLHLHGSRLDDFHAGLPGWARRWLRRTLDAADAIIVPGRYWRDVVVDTVRIDPARVHVVANAVAGPPRVAPRSHATVCELSFVGNLSARKGLPELLESLADESVAPLSWRLRVAGDGDARPFVARAARLGIADRVDFVGWITEARVRELLAATDVFVLPSHHEGLSVAMLEAMAHGCAVVTTPVGATLDAVNDGESALVVPAGDTRRLAAALRRAITDPVLRAALQGAARQRWHDHFQIAEHCRHLVALYATLCPALALERAPAVPAPIATSLARR